MRARGLKPVVTGEFGDLLDVAPHAGAWIETSRTYKSTIMEIRSRPMRARGLKLNRLSSLRF